MNGNIVRRPPQLLVQSSRETKPRPIRWHSDSTDQSNWYNVPKEAENDVLAALQKHGFRPQAPLHERLARLPKELLSIIGRELSTKDLLSLGATSKVGMALSWDLCTVDAANQIVKRLLPFYFGGPFTFRGKKFRPQGLAGIPECSILSGNVARCDQVLASVAIKHPGPMLSFLQQNAKAQNKLKLLEIAVRADATPSFSRLLAQVNCPPELKPLQTASQVTINALNLDRRQVFNFYGFADGSPSIQHVYADDQRDFPALISLLNGSPCLQTAHFGPDLIDPVSENMQQNQPLFQLSEGRRPTGFLLGKVALLNCLTRHKQLHSVEMRLNWKCLIFDENRALMHRYPKICFGEQTFQSSVDAFIYACTSLQSKEQQTKVALVLEGVSDWGPLHQQKFDEQVAGSAAADLLTIKQVSGDASSKTSLTVDLFPQPVGSSYELTRLTISR